MKTYSLKIRPKTSFLTPWQADTIFGSLCWIVTWRQGGDALSRLLAEYINGSPPLILSDAMPSDLLPVPAHLSLSVGATQDVKKIKKLQWLKPDDFESVRRGKFNIPVEADIKPFKLFDTLHSSVNRISGTTGDEGSLFELEEFAIDSEAISADFMTVYMKIKDGKEKKILSLFRDLSTVGYGAKRSSGKGGFELIGELEDASGMFDSFEGANGFVSLSNFVPAKNDPTEGYYKTMVKYGKLSGGYANVKNPFKKPLLMLEKGAVFKCPEPVKEYYGRMVKGVSASNPDVVQYGYAFAVPVKLE